jgi:high-affinity iron transporter
MYLGLVAIPMRRLFAVTTWLITLLAAGMASQAVVFLQQAGYFQSFAEPLWNTSGILPEDSIPGRLLRGLIGYSDSPTAAQLAAYLLTIAVIIMLMRVVSRRRGAAAASLAKT